MPDLSSALHLAASEVTLAVGALVLLMVGAFVGDKSARLVSILSVLLLIALFTPIADPARRHMKRTLLSDEIPSPIRKLGDEPVVQPLVQVGKDHFVARHPVGGAY